MTTTILQFGATGQLAREMLLRSSGGVTIKALSRADVDVTDTDAVARAIGEALDVDLVFNATAYAAVDKAESEPDLAYAVNARGPEAMAKACQARGVPMIHISTDMVFDGEKSGPYVETDATNPLHVYGASKLAGEQAVLEHCDRALVARVSWLFSAFGQNFLQMMLKLADTQPLLKIVDDQRARPTASGDVAGFMLSQAQRLSRLPAGAPEWGLLHLVNAGVATRFQMAQAIFELARPDQPLPTMAPSPPAPSPPRRGVR
uniref:dTDP-4-dehydrorhamnose reductase n=1 Tax=Phenylobacterium glaciei TaxID=2803784 RepID=A0A974S8W2_9CAUL|nr:dTDP-4-dehydrorhamnose reductase [Phenylobacterium glaciei]